MNALLRIQVTVAAREAQAQLRSLRTTINQVNKAQVASARGSAGSGMNAAAAGTANLNKQLTWLGKISQKVNGQMKSVDQGMIQTGKNLQWVGRQINFNFTIPLILAGRAVGQWALDQERAFTRVRKVYGETGVDYTAELGKIQTAIRMLSDYYGVNITQVTELAAQWAAAGQTGAALAESVKASLDLSILGDYEDLGDIFKQLITIQTAYKLNAGQLKTAIAELNTTENMTAATLPDLVTGIAKAGSSAEMAGVNFQHLAAFMAVLTPATGSAANAGNALKTIFSRLAKPTQDTIDVLKEMGINMASATWQVLNGSEKLELMATKFATLTDAQKAFVAGTVGARWQVNKFSEIMGSIIDKEGTYQKVLAAITGEGADTKNLAAANREIGILLDSDPRKLQIVTNSIKNLLIDAIAPAIPAITLLLEFIKGLFEWFGRLNPNVQKVIVGLLLLTAAVGIAAQMIGSFKLLFGTFLEFLVWIAKLLPGVALEAEAAAATTAAAATAAGAEVVVAAETTSVGVAAAASSIPILMWVAIAAALAVVTYLVIRYRKQIGEAIGNVINFIKRGFNSLPGAIQNALLAVAHVVASIVKTIVHWLSYLNPFARHSPSLVDSVTAGVNAILVQYERLAGIGSVFAQATKDLADFTAATEKAVQASQAKDRGEQRTSIVSTSPNAGPSTDAMYSNLDALNALLGPLNDAITKQQTKVDQLSREYDLAGRAIDRLQASMKPLEDLVKSLSDQIDAAKQSIQDYADTNITGMKAASDAIFDNEMAQKKLRLELLQLGDAGQGYEDIRKQIDLLNGDIETIRGTMTDLQQSGAGSDITKTYQDQLDALQAQKDSLTTAAENGADLTKQLEDLQRQGEIMDLQKSLNFDPLLKQIDELANPKTEKGFDQIIQGIKDSQVNLDQLTVAYNINKAALDDQQATLDKMTTAREELKTTYDDENAILGALKDQYQSVEDQIRSITDALDAATAAAKNLTAAASGGGGGGGGGGIPFEDLIGEFDPTTLADDLTGMQETIDQWIEDMKKQFAGIDINPFNFIKKGWNAVQDFWNKHIGPWLIKIPGQVVSGFNKAWDAIWDFFKKLPGKIAGYFDTAWDWAFEGGKNILKGVWNGITDAASAVWQWFLDLPGKIGEFFVDAWNWLPTAGSAIIQGLWDGMVLIAKGLFAWFIGIPAFLTGVFAAAIVWLVQAGWDIIQGLWDGITDAAVAVWNWFLDLPNRLKGYFTTAWDWLFQKGKDILVGLKNGIVDAANAVWQWFLDLPGRLKDYFLTALQWLITAGQDILNGLWNGIKSTYENVKTWFMDLPGNVKDLLVNVLSWLYDIGKNILQGLWNGLKDKWKEIASWFGDRINDVKNWFTSGFGLFSPSKVFRGYGENLMAGFKNGMIAGFAPIPGEMDAMIRQINGAMVDGVSAFSATASINGSASLNGGTNGSKSITFNGDLSFPNITDPDDAEKFIQNLEALAGV